jgi:hypothetical protein
MATAPDPSRAHRLPPGNVLLTVKVPAALANERTAFQRTSSRARGDWPIAEAVVRVVVTDGAIRFVRVAVGGVANTPLRLTAVEQRLLAQRPSPALLLDASGLVGQGTLSPPGAAHKLEILRATVLTALERALAPADPQGQTMKETKATIPTSPPICQHLRWKGRSREATTGEQQFAFARIRCPTPACAPASPGAPTTSPRCPRAATRSAACFAAPTLRDA